MKRPHDALAVFDRLIALVPDKAEAHYFRARTMVDMDMLEEALGAYKTALDPEPNAPDYLTGIAATYLYARAIYARPEFCRKSAGIHAFPGIGLTEPDQCAAFAWPNDRGPCQRREGSVSASTFTAGT
jgi:tetratricopeptide (TPR) repeat protein